ncbi:MAG TPA: hypothetical protein VI322_01350 [Candidatus Saccharimonadia bacterium]
MARYSTTWLKAVVLLGGLAGGAWLYLNWQTLADNYALSHYTSSSEVGQIIDRLNLTHHAKAVLYRAQPQIDDKTAFNQDCQTRPHELELGCYYHGRIYILRIDNASLAPEMTVVTAHELLHAVWAELPAAGRQRLSSQLEAEYTALNDNDLNDRMKSYAVSEPGEQANELHSILATEYASLPAGLATYYAQYFNDRAVVTADHAAYEQVFAARRQQLEQDLATIRDKKAQLAVLNRRMEALRSSGQIAAYNALVPGQNKLVDDINARIDQYQAAVVEYNALSKSLDSQEITDTETAAQ